MSRLAGLRLLTSYHSWATLSLLQVLKLVSLSYLDIQTWLATLNSLLQVIDMMTAMGTVHTLPGCCNLT